MCEGNGVEANTSSTKTASDSSANPGLSPPKPRVNNLNEGIAYWENRLRLLENEIRVTSNDIKHVERANRRRVRDLAFLRDEHMLIEKHIDELVLHRDGITPIRIRKATELLGEK